MKFTANLTASRIDISGYRAALKSEMSDVIARAVMAWMDEVLGPIPNWSGASRATFKPLADAIGSSVPDAEGRRAFMGVAMSEGKLSIDEPPNQYTFTYATDLPWLIWNEYHNANVDPDPTLFHKLRNPGPYHFQKLGMLAFNQFSKGVNLLSARPFIIAGRKFKV